jgi:protein-disulfide isomerase
MQSRLNSAVNIAILAVLGVLLLSPAGPAATWLDHWLQARKSRSQAERVWPQLIAASSALGPTTDQPRFVVEFIDYQCPSCASIANRLEAAAERTGTRVIIRHFPLPGHAFATAAAKIAICSEDEAFQQIHHALFTVDWNSMTNQPDWRMLAEGAGVSDLDRLEACLNSDATTQRLAVDRHLAEELNVRGTPTFVSQRGVFFGAGQMDKILGSK